MFAYTNGSLTNTSKDLQALNHNLDSKIIHTKRISKEDLDNILGFQEGNTELPIPNKIFFFKPKVKVPSMVKHTNSFPNRHTIIKNSK